MKILYITHYSSFYGANRSLFQLMKEIKEKGNEIAVLTPDDGEFYKACKKKGIICFASKFYNFLTNQKSKLKNIVKMQLNHYLFKKAFINIKKSFHPDIIHVNSSLSNIGVYLANRFNCKLVWHIREYGDVDYNLHYTYSLDKVLNIYEKANRIIFISNDLQRNYEIEKFKHKFPNSIVIYNGISNDYSIENNKDCDIINFLICGVISPQKNQIEVIKACKELLNRDVKNFRLYIVGDGPNEYVNSIKQYVEENSLQDYVIFVGYQKDVKPYLKLCHWGIMPSNREAFGRTTVEYGFAGLPVIANDSGANPEIIHNGINGYIYKHNDVDALCNLMEEAIMMKENEYKELSKSSKLEASKFSSTKNSQSIYEEYCKLLKIAGGGINSLLNLIFRRITSFIQNHCFQCRLEQF